MNLQVANRNLQAAYVKLQKSPAVAQMDRLVVNINFQGPISLFKGLK